MISTYEKEFEAQKIKLSQLDDYNLIDAFGVIDLEGKGCLNPTELHIALRKLDIPAS